MEVLKDKPATGTWEKFHINRGELGFTNKNNGKMVYKRL
jgi:hypothetical protein